MIAGTLYRRRPFLVVSLMILVIGGTAAFFSLPQLEDPRLTNRNPLVLTLLPGASAEQVEAQITEPIERRLREVDQVKRIESTSSLGISFVILELADTVTDVAPVLADLRSELDAVETELPPEASKPSLDHKRGAAAYGLIFSIRSRDPDAHNPAVLTRHAEELADQVRDVPGTELARLHGDVEEQVWVEVDTRALAAHGLSARTLANRLHQSDTRRPIGSLRSPGSGQQLIQAHGALDTLDRVCDVTIVSREGSRARVADVASVRRGYQDPPVALATYRGHPTVLVGVRMQPAASTNSWSNRIREVADRFAQSRSGDTRVEVVFDQGDYTGPRLRDLGWNLGLGAGLIWIVVALMMGWRVGTLVATALPLAGLGIFLGFQLLGVPLHQISVFGLLVSMGLLIDNAIVVTDDVWKLRRAGHTPFYAVVHGTRHLRVPLGASTLTTALSFAPILLLQGNVGEFVGLIGTAVILAVFVSLVLSLTLSAALAGLVPLSPPRAAGSKRRALAWFKDTPWLNRLRSTPVLVGLTLLAPLAGFVLAPTLKNQFFPAADRNQFQIELFAHPTASVRETQRLVERVDEVLRRDPAVQASVWVAGQSLPSVYYNQVMVRDDAPAYAQGVVTTTNVAAANALLRRCEAELAAVVPEAMVVVRPFAQGPPVPAPVLLRIHGEDVPTLVRLGEQVRAVIASATGVLNTRASIGHPVAATELKFDESALSALGLSPAAAADQLRLAMDGSVFGNAAGEVIEGTQRIPVVVRQPGMARQFPEQLRGVELVTPEGLLVPAGAVATLRPTSRTAAITRRNGQRVNSLFGFVGADFLPIEAVEDVQRRLEAKDMKLPDGYHIETGGDAEESERAAEQLIRYIPLLGTLVVATLILATGSLWLTLLLLTVGVLSAGYGLLALWCSGYPLGFNPLIGLAGLIGITFNDSIVVLAAIRADSEARSGAVDAIRRVVRDCRRHVWATTLTTATGFLPLLLFSGGDFWPPLAVVIAGGVLGATPLALAFVPAAYRALLRFRPRLGQQPQGVPS